MPSSSILVCNAGSSSLKAELFHAGTADQPRSIARVTIGGVRTQSPHLERPGHEAESLPPGTDHGAAATLAAERLLGASGRVVASGHRVVHGGRRFRAPVLLDAAARAELAALNELAPQHNPPALAALEAIERRLPGVPAVAVFDTAFFSGLPEHVRRYAVPVQWQAEHGVERYGFHGLAHEWMCRRLAELGEPAERVVTLQLGAGCSAAALRDGRAAETSMGFTPLEGLIMTTRCGDLDPGVLLAMARRGHDWQSLERALQGESGLRGLSGASGDVRELLALEADGHAGAALALAAFVHRVRKYIGAYAAVLGGLEAIAFGGGIGENSAEIRARICRGLEWLGVKLDEPANAAARGLERRISTPASAVAVHVIEVREEPLIAAATLGCLAAAAESTSNRAHRVPS